jgi:uncharacterized protein (TIGR02246 family)
MAGPDETGVRALLDRIYCAFADHDADAYAAPYSQSAVAVMPGAYLSGRDALHAAMRQLFAGPLAGATATFDVQSIRQLGAGVAVVISRGKVLLAGQSDLEQVEPWLDTWVLSQAGDGWQVESFHSCPERA